MEQLWRNLDAAIVSPRMDVSKSTIPAIKVEANELELQGQADASVDALLSDLETVFIFVARKLPSDLLQSLSSVMMGDVVPKLIQQWLNPAVPSSLTDMTNFQTMVQRARSFCTALQDSGYTGFDELTDWASQAPTTWLGKCRENALDTIRTNLARGIGKPKQVEKVEKHMVSLSEGKELATTGAGAAADTNEWGEDWGDAWDDDGVEQIAADSQPQLESKFQKGGTEDDGADAWGWDDDHAAAKALEETNVAAEPEGEDDSADAWGWGDTDATVGPAVGENKKHKSVAGKARKEETRELVLKETYNISSMPEPVLELIFAILEDGAVLTKDDDDYRLVSSTAPGLFSLPTFALALFRAISPYFYSLDVGGNMSVWPVCYHSQDQG